ncbi:hypothetical protein TUMSATVNIG1_52690 [Vibrio nigripulchritudo]|uniref:hypothetical protein n=1 Tax=Vibrio nigripulchritudo TaxID=28173 RepID=UPI001909EC98|nr:hypothetical protein [Vibrio nigripulchritudo]BCL73295.1 hypothetical protein VNTUMSATTG_52320 [Vibrio nigripulchritudo]BDU34660.1 hypothetical protein TUMSATVNIG1_52690 [Vibrio nigripulchritudo]
MKKALIAVLTLIPLGCATASKDSVETSIGDVYADNSGKSLYTFSKDPAGQSVCTGGCAEKWPPLLAQGSNQTLFYGQKGFSTITRKDGTKQWALNDKPLYRWFKDSKSGDITGAGIKGVWPLARADDVSVKLYNDGKRRFLVDSNNLTLYTFDKDKNDQSVCYGECQVKWPPAYVDSKLMERGADKLKLSGDFGVTQRKDNTYQWTYKNQPLYRWFQDTKPGETNGDGVKQVWHLVKR